MMLTYARGTSANISLSKTQRHGRTRDASTQGVISATQQETTVSVLILYIHIFVRSVLYIYLMHFLYIYTVT